MNPRSLKKMIDQKLLDDSFQVFLIDEDEFGFRSEKNIKSKIQFSERDHLTKIEREHVRLVFWEELRGADVSVNFSENIDEINLIIDGNTFGCMDEWGFKTFTDYSFISGGKKLESYLESESYGEQVDKVLYLINHSGKCGSIRYLDNNDDFALELSDAFEELGLL